MHANYGGVVPELASRDHVRKVLPLIQEALADAGVEPSEINGIAYTAGPGLVGALLVGAVRRSQSGLSPGAVRPWESTIWKGICSRRCSSPNRPQFPFLALLVSGGHTLLAARSRASGDTRFLAARSTMPPARPSIRPRSSWACPYPGGPALAKLAQSGHAGPLQVSAPDARSSRPRLQLQRPQDRSRRRDPRPAARRRDPRRRRGGIPAGRRRYARREVPPRARSNRASRRSSSPAVSARIKQLRQALAALGHKLRRHRQLSAADVLHRQRGDDRLRRLVSLVRGEHDDLSIRATARWPLDTLRAPAGDR